MQDQGFEGTQSSPRESTPQTRNFAGAAKEAYERTAELGSEAAERARAAAAEAAAAAKSQMKGVLDRQVGVAAAMVGDVARSFHVAAEELDRNTPLVGDLMRGVADRISGYADDLQEQSADDLLRGAADYTRRQPALVFGLAALAGFFMFRAVKNTPASVQAPSIQPSQQSFGSRSGRRFETSPQSFEASGQEFEPYPQTYAEDMNPDDGRAEASPRKRTKRRRDGD